MYFFLHSIKRFLFFPFEFFLSPNGMVGSLWNESVRSRAMLMGLPAIVIATLGVGLLCWAQYGMAQSLEDRYRMESEHSAENKAEVLKKLKTEETRLRNEAQVASLEGSHAPPPRIPEDDPDRKELERWQDREEVYLEKLIVLNDSEPEYKFRLAIVLLDKKEFRRGMALMNLIAPISEPGYFKAHLWLANYFILKRASERTEKVRNLQIALAHTENCLKRESGYLPALHNKARLLEALKEYRDAYLVYQILFEDDPQFFQQLVDINERLGRGPSLSRSILEAAIDRIQPTLHDPTVEDLERMQKRTDLTNCYLKLAQIDDADPLDTKLGYFKQIEKILVDEIALQSSPSVSGERIHAERLLAGVYLAWTGQYPDNEHEMIVRRLELLKQAFQMDPRNVLVLRELTRIGGADDPAAEDAKSIYNPAELTVRPAVVLNELGTQALSRAHYQAAKEYFNQAKNKSPQNAEILNNLAYTYLKLDPPQPRLALSLIDQAFRTLPNSPDTLKYRTFFHDTRGHAMMKLNRMTEAIAEFELARQERPNNRDILNSLVTCHRAVGLDPSAYLSLLSELESNPED